MPKKSSVQEGHAPARSQSSWSLRGSSLRFKMALAVTMPMVVAAILGALQVRGDLSQYVDYGTSARQVSVLGPAIDYLTSVEAATVAAQGDSKASQSDFTRAVSGLTSAAERLQARRGITDLTADQRSRLEGLLDLSRAAREEADSLSAETWLAQARQLQASTTQLIDTLIDAQVTPEPRLELLAQALSGRFSLSMQQALAASDRSGGTSSLELYSELGVEAAAIDRLSRSVEGSDAALLKLRTDNAQRFRAVRTGRDGLGGAKAYAPYDTVIKDLSDGIDQHLAQAAQDSQRDAVVNGITTVVAFAGAVLLALLASRLLLDPIRRVREGTAAVASEHLPDAVARIRSGQQPRTFTPIAVHTTEEMGQLARAVDDLHRQAIHLAASEAEARAQVDDMFVTLSRRNTTLVNQQLDLIESLEKDEEDPRRLESLFRLDHLATRMRRTADSLLILGNAPTRPADQTSLSVAEALQAGTAAVLEYRRVRVSAAVDQLLAPTAAADVVHLLTELVDNALAFSPPTTQVEMNAYQRTDGVDIEVVDSGVGITPAELDSINLTLAQGAQITADTARRMGLFVVSRLAQRHGIQVHLSRNTRGGITARVHLSRHLLAGPAPVVVPEPAAVGETVRPGFDAGTNSATTATAALSSAATVTPTSAHQQVAPSAAPTSPVPVVPTARSSAGSGAPATAQASLADDTSLPAREAERPGPSLGSVPAGGLPQRRPGATAALPGGPGETITDAFGAAARPGLPARTPAQNSDASPRPSGVEPGPASTSPPTVTAPDPVPGSSTAPSKEDETPMFRNLTSSWFGEPASPSWTASEVEQGWDRAGEVAEAPSAPATTEAGLPVRRPGTRLMPGSVTPPTPAPTIDPEVVRARLAAHAAGVTRGRRMASAPTSPNRDDNSSPHDSSRSTDQEEGTA